MLEKAIAGDGIAIEEMLKSFTPLLVNMHKKFKNMYLSDEEFLQEGRIILVKALETYNGKIEFGLWYKILLKRHCVILVRRQHTYSELRERAAVLAENCLVFEREATYQCDRVENDRVLNCHLEEIYQKFIKSLSKTELSDLSAFLAGEEINERVGVKCQQSYRASLRRTRNKFKIILNENGWSI